MQWDLRIIPGLVSDPSPRSEWPAFLSAEAAAQAAVSAFNATFEKEMPWGEGRYRRALLDISLERLEPGWFLLLKIYGEPVALLDIISVCERQGWSIFNIHKDALLDLPDTEARLAASRKPAEKASASASWDAFEDFGSWGSCDGSIGRHEGFDDDFDIEWD